MSGEIPREALGYLFSVAVVSCETMHHVIKKDLNLYPIQENKARSYCHMLHKSEGKRAASFFWRRFEMARNVLFCGLMISFHCPDRAQSSD